MRALAACLLLSGLFMLLTGCGRQPPVPAVTRPDLNRPAGKLTEADLPSAGATSDLEQVRAADVSILFVGNSHSMVHDLPSLVGKMIQFRHPERKVYAHVVCVAFLDDVARIPTCREEIESRPWKYVVLQAQKVSMSGRYDYSQKEGIEIAKLARSRGASALFFSEWGRQGVADEGPRTERIYRQMARASAAGVAPIGRAWDLALAERPDLPLHSADGNHQSSVGAFLTACVLVGRLTGESPAPLASFPYLHTSAEDRKFLAEAAAKAMAQDEQ